jgi:predicted transcriptional regulator of viral defense system
MRMKKQEPSFRSVRDYLEELQSVGRFSVAFDELERHIPKSKAALQQELHRLKKARRIILLREKFYLILSPEHRRLGILPFSYFIHDLMTWLKRPYYVSILSAAALNGVMPQAVFSHFVIMGRPPLRDILKKTIRIHFLVKSPFPQYGIMQMKTVTGEMNVSSPELTAIDLLRYPEKSGGIYQTISLIRELSEFMELPRFSDVIGEAQPTVILQRLGYILERYTDRRDLLLPIQQNLFARDYRTVVLGQGEPDAISERDAKWKIALNIDEENIE